LKPLGFFIGLARLGLALTDLIDDAIEQLLSHDAGP